MEKGNEKSPSKKVGFIEAFLNNFLIFILSFGISIMVIYLAKYI
jgi:hypothetical protein